VKRDIKARKQTQMSYNLEYISFYKSKVLIKEKEKKKGNLSHMNNVILFQFRSESDAGKLVFLGD